MIIEKLCDCLEEACVSYTYHMFNRIKDTKDIKKLIDFANNNANPAFERAISAHLAADHCKDPKEALQLDYLCTRLLFSLAKQPDNMDSNNATQALPSSLLSLAESLYNVNQRDEAVIILEHAEKLLPEITLKSYRRKVEKGIKHYKKILNK